MNTPIREPLKPKFDNQDHDAETVPAAAASGCFKPRVAMSTQTPQKHQEQHKEKGTKRNGSGILSSIKKKGGKLRRALTPPKDILVGCAKTPLRLKTPQPLTFSPKFRNAGQYQLKSCEMDPSPFQIDIPSHESILASCKICAIMDNYVELGGVNFDFSSLMPFGGTRSPDINVLLMGGALENKTEEKETNAHPILLSLQNVAKDIVVEGFYREHVEEIGRIEVCIFSSESQRQFYVVYRGCTKLQDHPMHGTQRKGSDSEQSVDDDNNQSEYSEEIENPKRDDALHKDVNEMLLDAYNQTNLEESIFTLLNRLTGFKPFYDVCVTGHSFGGMMATVAAYKYAKRKPATRIRCQVFGSPKVGGRSFRDEVHSLPNLNIVRVERGTDPFICLPMTHGSEWMHVGHSLRIQPSLLNSFTVLANESKPLEIQLFRFDKLRPSASFVTSSVNSVCNFSKLKIGNEIRSYLKDLEKVSSLQLKWPDAFAGEISYNQHVANGYLA